MQENLLLAACVVFVLWYLLGFSAVCLAVLVGVILIYKPNTDQKKGGYESNGIYIEDPVIREI
jgi:hypothetical protein